MIEIKCDGTEEYLIHVKSVMTQICTLLKTNIDYDIIHNKRCEECFVTVSDKKGLYSYGLINYIRNKIYSFDQFTTKGQ